MRLRSRGVINPPRCSSLWVERQPWETMSDSHFCRSTIAYQLNSGDTLTFAIQNIVEGINAFSATMTGRSDGHDDHDHLPWYGPPHKQHHRGQRESNWRIQLCVGQLRQNSGTRPRNCFQVERHHHNGKLRCRSRRCPIPCSAPFRPARFASCDGLIQQTCKPAPSFAANFKWWCRTGQSPAAARVTRSPVREANASKTIRIKCNIPALGPAPVETSPVAPFIPQACLDRPLVALTRPRKTTRST